MRTLVAALIGFASGVASGAFGIGGALLSTPGIRWALDTPALVSVGTTLPVIIPTAITGVYAYFRNKHVELRTAVVLASAGATFAVLGAYMTEYIRGEVLLVTTAVLIFFLSIRMLPGKAGAEEPAPRFQPTIPVLLVTGAVSGFVCGLLGVGGGVILVPVLTVVLRFPVKTALGTSLAVVAAQAIPGSITHWVIGNIDWAIAGGLVLGTIPGARIGSKLAVAAEDRSLRTVVAICMAVLAIVFGATELRELLD